MKTTAGHTVTRRPARRIEIWQRKGNRRELLTAVRWASSMSQALREFAKERYGKHHDGVVVGNTLTVANCTFVAKETR